MHDTQRKANKMNLKPLYDSKIAVNGYEYKVVQSNTQWIIGKAIDYDKPMQKIIFAITEDNSDAYEDMPVYHSKSQDESPPIYTFERKQHD